MDLLVDYRQKAKGFFKELGISENVSGFSYLVEVSLYQFKCKPTLKTKPSLEYVADKYDTTYRNVQNSIQYALRPLREAERVKGMKQVILECVDYLNEVAAGAGEQ